MQIGFYFDQTRCTGCSTCAVACKDWHDIPAGPANWMRVTTIEKGKYPNPFLAFLSSPCFHCIRPVCVAACPVGAIEKRPEDGIVVVNRDRCLGRNACDKCLRACPYQAPQFGAEEDARMQKCDYCLDRWLENKLPICVAGCPMRALDAGPLEALEARHGKVHHAEGFTYYEKIGPSVIFKPRAQKAAPSA